uniref:Uncharacterized protein n=1 Tax=Tetranychus urticae TaxID=32264 RepID=T1KWQ6_TETUR
MDRNLEFKLVYIREESAQTFQVILEADGRIYTVTHESNCLEENSGNSENQQTQQQQAMEIEIQESSQTMEIDAEIHQKESEPMDIP